jgi:CheY-like chemotaxis protein
VKMPKCDGHELIRFIRGRDLNLPIIALTGHYSLIDLDKLNEAGASLTIKKPILLGDLLGSLQHLLL